MCADIPQFTGDKAFESRKAEHDGKPFVDSSDGTVRLTWGDHAEVLAADSESDLAVYQLQQGGDESFANAVTRYEGTDVVSYLSGLSEGAHFFRVREADGEWSVPIEVKVTFIDRRHLFFLLAVGFTVAALTAGAIILGHFKHRHDS
ncbi:MAG: hypothetical protein KDN19_08035 [Verrucomicrobiae bacterium]|nr:hypothetical protein [Verrucomicrobiae bacterium]